jgi:hypothetical protein
MWEGSTVTDWFFLRVTIIDAAADIFNVKMERKGRVTDGKLSLTTSASKGKELNKPLGLNSEDMPSSVLVCGAESFPSVAVLSRFSTNSTS